MRLPGLLLFVVICAWSDSLAPAARAARVKVWHHHAANHHEKAQLRQIVVTNEGSLRLARQLRPLPKFEAAHVWDVLEDAAGNLWAATGGDGRVYKLTPEGKVTTAYTAEGGQALCLAVDGQGSVLIGTGPTAQVIRIDPRGMSQMLCELPESYVWSLAVDPKTRTIYAGTGPRGHVYKISPDGKTTEFYPTRQEHVLSVALGANGTVYAGTDKNGLIFRFDARGKGFVLYQAPQAEVRSLRVTADAIYAGTSATSRKRPGTTAGRSGGAGEVAAQPDGTSPPNRVNTAAAPEPTAVNLAAEKSSDSATARAGAPAPAPPAAGDNSVYRIGFDGSVRELFREKTLVMSLLPVNGRLFVGGGTDGQLFEVDLATRERNEAARLDHGQILALCRRRDGGIVVGTGDPGRLYHLLDRFAPSGTVLSEVLDAKLVSRWGALRWEADTPAGTRLTIACRSGNVAEPDDTWSDWSAEQVDPRQATVAAPPARYLQYRATLSSDDPSTSPTLRSLTVRYATSNQAPEVTKIEVPDLNAVQLENPKKLKIKWTATDANEDELTYSLFVRKDDWENWVRIDEEFEKTELEWDTTTTPSGTYRVKVVASDARDNPEGEALTGERISSPFVVSHEPPVVAVRVTGMDGDRARIEATASAAQVRLTSAAFAVDGKKWINVFPVDGLFDAKTEKFDFRTEGLQPGTHVLVLKVRDAAGNTGTADLVFTVRERAR